MTFIELTAETGKPIAINLDRVTEIRVRPDKATARLFTTTVFGDQQDMGQDYIDVRESYDDVIGRIQAAWPERMWTRRVPAAAS